MQYNFIVLRTKSGKRFAKKIINSIKWINKNKYPQHEFQVTDISISEFLNQFYELAEINPVNTLIHTRAANPRTLWTDKLRILEDRGYKVINGVDTIELTSNKLACSLHLQGKVNHPKSWEWKKSWDQEVKNDFIEKLLKVYYGNYIIAKPYTSFEQGANVKKVDLNVNMGMYEYLTEQFDSVPGNKIVVQEYIPYTALHRVIVINGKALPYVFTDYANDPRKNGDWKVSCCLNRETMILNQDVNEELLHLAEKTQKEVGGVINFIDIFEYNPTGEEIEWPMYTISEINTACNLSIHERLARNAGRKDWNIHYKIAKCLVDKLLS